MTSSKRLAIIDIGSNSIRLVIYEYQHDAHRILDESKETARLSSKIDEHGNLPLQHIDELAEILKHFKRLCEVHQVETIKAVATAAIRNAENCKQIVSELYSRTHLHIEVLSGEEEAKYGFLGTINASPLDNGYMIDIGGGSTEITYFEQRTMKHSISLPFGAVNMTKLYSDQGIMTEAQVYAMQSMLEESVSQIPWIRQHPGLLLIGLGGTVRSICKMIQKQKKYSLPLTHNYLIEAAEIDLLLPKLQTLPLERRKKIEGLGKNRLDIIVPGIVLLQTFFKILQGTHYVISGAGLRDGLFYEIQNPRSPILSDPLTYSVHNLLHLHPCISVHHVEQVNRIAQCLYPVVFAERHDKHQAYLMVAALLYRIGVSVHFYNYDKHTFYLIAHSRLHGLSHRDILICACIAAFKSKNKLKPYLLQYDDILLAEDAELIVRLGTLLQLAVALDRSETQPIEQLSAERCGNELLLTVQSRHSMHIEKKEVETLQKDLHKQLGLTVFIKDN